MQGFVVLLFLWLGLAVGQNTIVTTPTLTPHATLAPEEPTQTQTPATLAPEEPTRSTLAPPYIDICTRQGYNLTTLRE